MVLWYYNNLFFLKKDSKYLNQSTFQLIHHQYQFSFSDSITCTILSFVLKKYCNSSTPLTNCFNLCCLLFRKLWLSVVYFESFWFFPSHLSSAGKTFPWFYFSPETVFLQCHFHYLFELVFGYFGNFLPHLFKFLYWYHIFSLMYVVNIFSFDWVTKTNFLWASHPYELSNICIFSFLSSVQVYTYVVPEIFLSFIIIVFIWFLLHWSC